MKRGIGSVSVLLLICASCGDGKDTPIPEGLTPTPMPTLTSQPTLTPTATIKPSDSPTIVPTIKPTPTPDPSIAFGIVLQKAGESVVRVDCADSAGVIISYGTGFKVSSSEIVTAAHVTDNCNRVGFVKNKVYVASGAIADVYINEKDPTGAYVDLARLVIRTKLTDWDNIPSLSKVNRSVSIGERVGTIGFPAGFANDIQMSQGVVSATTMSDLSPTTLSWLGAFSFSAMSGSGNSGGPVVNASGEVIGVLVGKNTNTGTMIALPLP